MHKFISPSTSYFIGTKCWKNNSRMWLFITEHRLLEIQRRDAFVHFENVIKGSVLSPETGRRWTSLLIVFYQSFSLRRKKSTSFNIKSFIILNPFPLLLHLEINYLSSIARRVRLAVLENQHWGYISPLCYWILKCLLFYWWLFFS